MAEERSIGKDYSDQDVADLASAIYGEARNQNTLGKAAVGHTIATRAALGGVSIGDVVYGSTTKNYGQYSFSNPRDRNRRAVAKAPRVDPKNWASAVSVAKGILSGEIENPVPGATNYKVSGTKAGWAKKANNLGKVGSHTFYSLPEAEVRGVVRSAAYSPYRREALIGADAISGVPGSLGNDPGVYNSLNQLDGGTKTVSLGEFNFASPRVEKGFGRMRPETQATASEMARTMPAGQDMTITATHGQHGLSNLTHTPGAAFDVRTRGLSQGQLDKLVDSALYSRPASIGYNDGTGKFAAHMHIDTNAGYGKGLQSHSSLEGLSDYAKAELARYDAEMKSGLGYTPPVPESIAPVPKSKPYSSLNVARNPFDLKPAMGGLPAMASANPFRTPDGVPINRVQSVSIRPGQTTRPMQGPQRPTSLASVAGSLASSFSPVGVANAGTLGAGSARAAIRAQPSFSDIGTLSKTSRIGTPEFADLGTLSKTSRVGATQFADMGPISKTVRNSSIPSYSDIGTLAKTVRNPSVPSSIAALGTTNAVRPTAAAARTATTIKQTSLPASISLNPYDTMKARPMQGPMQPRPMQGPIRPATITPEIYGPVRPATVQTQPVQVKTLPDIAPVSQPRTTVNRAATRAAPTNAAVEMTARAPTARAGDVFSGKAATGLANDGSTLTRNMDGSITRTSVKSGISEVISKANPDFTGATIGGGMSYQAGKQTRSLGDAISDLGSMVRGALAGYPEAPKPVANTNKSTRGGLSEYGEHVRSESKQFDRAVRSGKGGLW